MTTSVIDIEWPNGKHSNAIPGSDWLVLASEVGIAIPTGCLNGSCGACEIEVNGKIIRACIATIPLESLDKLQVDFASDPYWE